MIEEIVSQWNQQPQPKLMSILQQIADYLYTNNDTRLRDYNNNPMLFLYKNYPAAHKIIKDRYFK
jgi:uncharacterized protein YihD (DUF1040 family)